MYKFLILENIKTLLIHSKTYLKVPASWSYFSLLSGKNCDQFGVFLSDIYIYLPVHLYG